MSITHQVLSYASTNMDVLAQGPCDLVNLVKATLLDMTGNIVNLIKFLAWVGLGLALVLLFFPRVRNYALSYIGVFFLVALLSPGILTLGSTSIGGTC